MTLIKPINAFIILQGVCDYAREVLIPLLILLLPVYFYSMYVIVLVKCRPSC
jgi:hypothetical protein